ncbi:MAG: nucleotide sugar dehydrogenase [Lachnospiraceae bacterium]|nr:nucleotide sugar dehydrogenase [Lachnospiraceae bacterium]
MKITVVGTGYVGLSLALLLAKRHEVTALDILEERVNKINNRQLFLQDKDMLRYMENKSLTLRATVYETEAYQNADIVIIAVPTNYDSEKEYFDTSTVDFVVGKVIENNTKALVIIKSTVPVGYTEEINRKYCTENILFSPEFLRETKALYDNLHPSRIIVGGTNIESQRKAKKFAFILKECSEEQQVPILIMGASEAEAVKLFSNTYLALRISFFNELDTYAEVKALNTKEIIKGVCYDPRIGDFYNNPSFGYGGYCLPKDTKQLLANYGDIPETLIRAIIESNETRKDFIAGQIAKKIGFSRHSSDNFNILDEKESITVGIYRLTMKSKSDNFRESSVQGVIKRLKARGITIVLYEPILEDKKTFLGHRIIKDIEEFKTVCDCIIANRTDINLDDVKQKVYTRDLYHRD